MKKKIELRECAACGALVPRIQPPPYSGHKKNCKLVKEWLKLQTTDHTKKEKHGKA